MEIFRKKSNNHLKRLIGFIDNDPKSETFGCADRNYWHYKNHDYNNARYQEAALALAFFYLDKDCFLYKNERLLNLIKGVIGFWAKNLNSNGSVNEIYPHEQSFCATSFSAYVITEAIELLKLEDEATGRKDALVKSGKWLLKNGSWHITNQVAASALALFNIGKLTGHEEFTSEARKRVDRLLSESQQTGYFKEYGGFDIGYNTITMSILARYSQKTGNNEIISVLTKVNEKIAPYLDDYW
jgi:hypothetical protein